MPVSFIAKIITWNIGDFDRKEPAKVGVVAETPDAFLCRLIADSPENVIAAFVRMQDNLRPRRKTTRECVDTLAAQGLKKFAGMISARIE
jgi:hypothetical protein